jgi:hypothetical protein
MTPEEPGASASEELLRGLQEDFAFLHAVLDKLSAQDEQRARLSKAAAARAGKIEGELREAIARLPSRPGPRRRPLDELLVQEILHMHEELGWGRPRILAAMRDSGVTERQVRRVLAEHAGRVSKPTGQRSRL